MSESTDTTTEDPAPAKKAAAKKTAATKSAATKKTAAKKAAPAKKAAAKKAAATNGATATEVAETRTARKVREGIVASTNMDRTAVVLITTRKPHPLYRKTMVRTSRLNAHDEKNELRVGDRVRVSETRPISKTKRWRLVEILERAK